MILDIMRVSKKQKIASSTILSVDTQAGVSLPRLFFITVSCPPPLKPRDFVLQRSWLDTGPNGEQMLLSRSVPHKDYPLKKGYVR